MLFANVIFPGPAFVYVLGIFLWPLAGAAMVAEFSAIRRIQAGKTPSRSIWINFVLANLLSTGVGAGLLFIPGFPTGYGDGPDIMANPLWVSLAIGYGLFSFVLSILIEWALYRYFPLFGGLRKPFQSSLWGNVCSYGILLSVMFFLIAANSKR
jgi:hypothetical protein